MAGWSPQESRGDASDAGPPGVEEKQDLARALQRCHELSLQRNGLVGFAQGLPFFRRAHRVHYSETVARLRDLCDLEERCAVIRLLLERHRGQFEAAQDARLAQSGRMCTTILRQVEVALADALTGGLATAREALARGETEMVRLGNLLAHQAERLDHLTGVIHDVDTRTVSALGDTAPLARLRLSAIEEAVMCDVTCPMEEVHQVTSSVDLATPADGVPGVTAARQAESWSQARTRLACSLQEAFDGVVLPDRLEPPSVGSPDVLASKWAGLRASLAPDGEAPSLPAREGV